MGGDQKRIKESFDFPEGLKNNLKDQVEDLKFIVNHLKTDVTCTIESSVKQLKMTVEREIGLLVYSLMEESLSVKLKLKAHLNDLKKENSLLIENEGNIMDELARLTLENEKLKFLSSTNLDEIVLKELDELEDIIYDDNYQLDTIKNVKYELEQSKSLLLQEQDKVIDYEKLNCSKDIQIATLVTSFNEMISKIAFISNELEIKNNEISELLNAVKVLETVKCDNERVRLLDEDKIKDLMDMNNELIDLGELGKQKELEMTRKWEELEKLYKKGEIEKEILREEIESLKKAMTAQKIELERGRETLNRERKLATLKISDLQEQVEELKNKKMEHFESDENSENRNKH